MSFDILNAAGVGGQPGEFAGHEHGCRWSGRPRRFASGRSRGGTRRAGAGSAPDRAAMRNVHAVREPAPGPGAVRMRAVPGLRPAARAATPRRPAPAFRSWPGRRHETGSPGGRDPLTRGRPARASSRRRGSGSAKSMKTAVPRRFRRGRRRVARHRSPRLARLTSSPRLPQDGGARSEGPQGDSQ